MKQCRSPAKGAEIPTPIFVVENHLRVQKALCDLLTCLPGLQVCGTASTAQSALEQLPGIGAVLALIAVSLPDRNGIALVGALQIRCPALLCLIFSSHQELLYVQRALSAGARGGIVKDHPQELAVAIRQVLQGGFI